MFEALNDAVIAVDSDGNYVIANQYVREMVGDDLSEIQLAENLTMSGLEAMTDVDHQLFENLPIVQKFVRDDINKGDKNDCGLNSTDSAIYDVSYRRIPIEPYGRNGLVLTFRDNTRLKRAESKFSETIEELQGRTRFMEQVFESVNDGLIVLDMNGRITLANPATERIFGKPIEDLPPGDWAKKYGIYDHKTQDYAPFETYPSFELWVAKKSVRKSFTSNNPAKKLVPTLKAALRLCSTSAAVK